ncbi:MAG: HD domain-containing protein [Candidatus Cloacimonetes bacterium]|nr:HD domain-containing protein [Candidatus Cloacimonadota bacterium]MCF7813269.1 HD domain-containing protein [Candidatus Cloacimonadota bacterium]MCF7867344.1 HD domain-containing protein [Candidatus Cloacimonadota bacterium]MCF7882778.1 HD domain-containing protein [Candidatus Cloacimonadota bacterium]
MDREKLQKIYDENIKHSSDYYSEFACRNEAEKRYLPEPRCHMRTPYAVDRDRILHSGAYRRYQGKTQVFSFTNMFDEETSNRSLHTTYVSQISRTISKMLRLNLELTEAIALGHDLGHSPFGHDGEIALSKCCQKYKIGQFHHNIQSLHIVDHISHRGKGLNLTFQVRDGIISHDGEVHNTVLHPNRNKTENDIKSYISGKKQGKKVNWMPATLEACVVRISDTIAYIGQDIEDAIRLNILKREEIPVNCAEYLGKTNSQIIDTLVKSVILNSYDKDQVAFDEETSHYLLKLKKFNYARIYTDKNVKHARDIINRSMDILFDQYLEDIETNETDSKVFTQFLNRKNENYMKSFNNAEKVRDFVATMTDRYYNEEIKNYLLPGSFY